METSISPRQLSVSTMPSEKELPTDRLKLMARMALAHSSVWQKEERNRASNKAPTASPNS